MYVFSHHSDTPQWRTGQVGHFKIQWKMNWYMIVPIYYIGIKFCKSLKVFVPNNMSQKARQEMRGEIYGVEIRSSELLPWGHQHFEVFLPRLVIKWIFLTLVVQEEGKSDLEAHIHWDYPKWQIFASQIELSSASQVSPAINWWINTHNSVQSEVLPEQSIKKNLQLHSSKYSFQRLIKGHSQNVGVWYVSSVNGARIVVMFPSLMLFVRDWCHMLVWSCLDI